MTMKAKPPSALLKSAKRAREERTVTVKFVNDENITIRNFVVSEFLFF